MIQCVLDKCGEQEDKCVAADRLEEATAKAEWAISVLPTMG